MKYIKLTKNKQAIIDNEDYKRVSRYKWTYHDMGYAYRQTWKDGHYTAILLHRFVMKVDSKQHIDHINHDGLDNRKSNLRIATQGQNLQNTSIRSDNTTGYKGVWFNKARNIFQAYIQLNHKHRYLGRANTAQEAYELYKEGAKELFGEFANI